MICADKKRGGNKISYGIGLYTIFSIKDNEEPLEVYDMGETSDWDETKQQYIHNPKENKLTIVWIGIRAKERTADYILKDNTGYNHYGVRDRYLKTNEGKISLSKYLQLK